MPFINRTCHESIDKCQQKTPKIQLIAAGARATAAIKAYLEPKGLYNYDPTPFWKAMWRIAKTCHYVEDIHGVQYYRSFEDVARGAANAKKAD